MGTHDEDYDNLFGSKYLDRNQAHLLMLYLQEHLGYSSNSDKLKLELAGFWKCSCGLMHQKDYVCERIKK